MLNPIQRPRAGLLGMTQAVSTYGVGSIYDMRVPSGGSWIIHSVMIAGLDFWPNDQTSVIFEPSLQRVLGVDHFRHPPVSGDEFGNQSGPAIPAVRFPGLYSCDKCDMLGYVGRQFQDPNFSGVRCGKANCTGKGIPFRFVVACHDKDKVSHPGHIDDFPYFWWAHQGEEHAVIDEGENEQEILPECNESTILLKSVPGKSGLEGLLLYCHGCKKGRSLAGVFSDGALSGCHCHGRRPWLGDREKCDKPLRVLQRGASNVYFPVTASAISIPPYSNRLMQALEVAAPWHFLNSIKQNPNRLSIIVEMIRGASAELSDPNRYTDQQVSDGLLLLAGLTHTNPIGTEADQKYQERNALVKGQHDEESAEFLAIPVDTSGCGTILSKYVGQLVQVHRLREVRALRGFQRVESGSDGDAYASSCAPISKKKMSWLPAIEVRGEGIYLELDPDAVALWEQQDVVANRISIIRRNLEQNGGDPNAITARYVLAHTLSHLVMKQLSLECGYSGSSLRERLYVGADDGQPYTGFLIYTASASADGTLGGLVSQADSQQFEGILSSTISSARWCSSDPLCIESTGQGVDALNLAACHACALIPETSCEARNSYLDRAMVVGTLESPEVGLFSEVIHTLD